MGKLTGWTAIKKVLKDQGKARDLVIKYKDSAGKQRYKGSTHLRGSELGSYLLEVTQKSKGLIVNAVLKNFESVLNQF